MLEDWKMVKGWTRTSCKHGENFPVCPDARVPSTLVTIRNEVLSSLKKIFAKPVPRANK